MTEILKNLICVAIVAGPLAASGASAAPNNESGSVETNCDVTGPDIKSMKQPDAKACLAACEELTTCRGWSFISGWNRCFLKSGIKSKTAVRMYAGRLDRGASPVTVVQQGWDKDDSGTDFRKVAPLSRSEECTDECLKDHRCVAFVFIEGYRVCWLKKSIGKWSDKTFSCGVRPK